MIQQIDSMGYADRKANSGNPLVEEWHHLTRIGQGNSDIFDFVHV